MPNNPSGSLGQAEAEWKMLPPARLLGHEAIANGLTPRRIAYQDREISRSAGFGP